MQTCFSFACRMALLLTAMSLYTVAEDAVDLDDVVAPVEVDGRVLVVTGKGDVLAKFPVKKPPRSGSLKIPEVAYHTPHGNPAKKVFVAVRKQLVGEVGESWREFKHSIVAVDWETGKETVLWHGVKHEPVFCPAWSPDGRYVAFLTYKDLLVVDTAGKVVQRVADVVPENIIVPDNYLHYLRWREDGEWIFIFHDRQVFAVDLENRRSGQLMIRNILFLNGRFRGRPVYGPGMKGAPQGQLPDIPAVTALFARPQDPLFAPQRAGQGRFVFYTRSSEGAVLNKQWLELWDSQTGKTYRVRTLDRDIAIDAW